MHKTHVQISVTKWCVVGYETSLLWYSCNTSIRMTCARFLSMAEQGLGQWGRRYTCKLSPKWLRPRLPIDRKRVLDFILFICATTLKTCFTLQRRHNGCDGVWNHQPHDYFLRRLFTRRSTKTSKLRVTGLCEGNLPVTGVFPAQMTSNEDNLSIWWTPWYLKTFGKFSFKFPSSIERRFSWICVKVILKKCAKYTYL